MLRRPRACVSQRAPTLSTILGEGMPAIFSLAHRRSTSRIGKLNRGLEASAFKALAIRRIRSTACNASRGASMVSV